jgi:hypothetical protein
VLFCDILVFCYRDELFRVSGGGLIKSVFLR